jgi:hypothetical protein
MRTRIEASELVATEELVAGREEISSIGWPALMELRLAVDSIYRVVDSIVGPILRGTLCSIRQMRRSEKRSIIGSLFLCNGQLRLRNPVLCVPGALLCCGNPRLLPLSLFGSEYSCLLGRLICFGLLSLEAGSKILYNAMLM